MPSALRASGCSRATRGGSIAIMVATARSPKLDSVSSVPAGDDVVDPGEAMYDLRKVAELLGIPVTRVHQQLRDRHLIAVRRAGAIVVPKIFFTDTGEVVKSLPGLLA